MFVKMIGSVFHFSQFAALITPATAVLIIVGSTSEMAEHVLQLFLSLVLLQLVYCVNPDKLLVISRFMGFQISNYPRFYSPFRKHQLHNMAIP